MLEKSQTWGDSSWTERKHDEFLPRLEPSRLPNLKVCWEANTGVMVRSGPEDRIRHILS